MATREEILRQDSEDLKRLGYAQQLFREMGGFSNFAVSFSVISILTGAVLLYGYGLKFAGPIVNTVGWPLVSVMTLTIAASMAELYLAYGIPIYLNLRNRARRCGEFTTHATAAWSLGRWGPAIAFVALLWVAVISVIFSLPPNELVLWTMLALAGVLVAYWIGSARARFRGPVRR
jgi:hypothetical protein